MEGWVRVHEAPGRSQGAAGPAELVRRDQPGVELRENPLTQQEVLRWWDDADSASAGHTHDWRVVWASVDTPLDRSPGSLSSRATRRCLMDLRPQVLLSRGPMIDALVHSGVHHYLEFKTLERAGVMLPTGGIVRVPCSKEDVLVHRHLGLRDKRALMRFLRSLTDHSVENDGDSALSLNERELASGRALHRPQNKPRVPPLHAVTGEAAAATGGGSHEKRESGRSLLATLSEAGLSEELQTVLRFAVALWPASEGPSEARGVPRLQTYTRAIGRFSASPFVVAVHGTGEIPQGFARLSAVQGAIYVLKVPIEAFLMDEDRSEAKGETTTSATGPPPPPPSTKKRLESVVVKYGFQLRAKQFVINPSLLPDREFGGMGDKGTVGSTSEEPGLASRWIVRYAAVTSGPLWTPAPSEGRVQVTVPPRTEPFGNAQPVFILQSDASSGSTPAGIWQWQCVSQASSREEATSLVESIRSMVHAWTTAKKPNAAADEEEEEGEASSKPELHWAGAWIQREVRASDALDRFANVHIAARDDDDTCLVITPDRYVERAYRILRAIDSSMRIFGVDNEEESTHDDKDETSADEEETKRRAPVAEDDGFGDLDMPDLQEFLESVQDDDAQQ